MASDNQQRRSKQKRLYIVFMGTVSAMAIVFIYSLVTSAPESNQFSEPVKSVSLPTDSIDVNDAWRARMETEKQLLDQRLAYMEESITRSKQSEEKKDKENYELRSQLQKLKIEIQQVQATPPAPVLAGPAMASYQEAEPLSPPGGFLTEIVMEDRPKSKVQDVNSVIPAGTTVKALLVSSVDAPCGVYANADPHPVKLRILDDGHLPHSVRAKLKGGIIIASAYGDISSERIFVRLERLTQTSPPNGFIETAVTGYVTGEDGKYGVRGVVADKSERLIASAAFSGFLGGLSNYLQATVNTQEITSSMRGLPNDARWDILRDSSLTGATSAMDKLSEYFIKRAEQLLPVVQVAAGRVVDITFTHGAEVGDIHTQKKVQSVRKEHQQTKKIQHQFKEAYGEL